MTVTDFLLPVFVQVALTFVLHTMMALERMRVLKSGEVKVRDVALRQQGWPLRATQYANAYHNQLELPLLFFALIAFILIAHAEGFALLVLAWIFVLTRLAHGYVHVTSNHVPTRARLYGLGVAVLIVMWVLFAIKILTGAT